VAAHPLRGPADDLPARRRGGRDLRLQDRGYPADSATITAAAFALGAKGVICHGFAGEDSVRACVEAGRGDVFVVTEMSHPGGQQFTAPVAEDLAKLAVKAGASGIIAPATRPERVKRLRAIVGDLLILAPGAGAQGGKPADAIAAGADYVIVGRAITESPEPPRPRAGSRTKSAGRQNDKTPSRISGRGWILGGCF